MPVSKVSKGDGLQSGRRHTRPPEGAMTYVDSALLNLTERLCRRLQVLTGRTNVWLAFQLTNLSIVIYFVWLGMVYVVSEMLGRRIFVTLVSGGVLFMLSKSLFRESVEASEADAYRRVARGLMNPRRLRDAQLRISFLSLSVLLTGPLLVAYLRFQMTLALLTYSLVLLTTVLLYVLACDPLPPCPGKVVEWVRGLVRLSPVRET